MCLGFVTHGACNVSSVWLKPVVNYAISVTGIGGSSESDERALIR